MAGFSFRIVAVAALLAVHAGSVVSAQEDAVDLASEIGALKQGQEDIIRQIQEIRGLLGTRQAPRPTGPAVAGKVFDLGDNPVKGSEDATLVLVEFTDYQCPFCSRHFQQTHPQIASQYIESGKIRFATMDLPLERIHPLAMKAAEATHCAQEQGRFWEMHDRLFASQKALEPWPAHAEAVGIDTGPFEECLESGRYMDSVRKDMAEASKAGVSGTPSFVLGSIDPATPSKIIGIAFIRGAQPFSAFKKELDAALGDAADAKAIPRPSARIAIE